MKNFFAWALSTILLLGTMAFSDPQDAAKGKAEPAVSNEKQADISGKWSGTFEHKEDGETKSEPIFMIFKQDGDKLTGSGGPNESEQHPLRNGKVEGDRLTFEVETGKMTIAFDLKVKDDQITGDMKADKEGSTRTAKLSMKRLAEKLKTDQPSPPGKLVDLGGRRLHINCMGEGSPTVVIENGGGGFSFQWILVQPEVAKFTRVCTYDRAGHAWSDPPPSSSYSSPEDLHALVRAAGETGPFVLVGQSIGGLLIREYQRLYPAEVVGMVFVDSSHENGYMIIRDREGKRKLVRMYSPVRDERVLPEEPAQKPKAPSTSLPQASASPQSRVSPPFDRLPPDAQSMRQWARVKGPGWGAIDYGRLDTIRRTQPYPLGDIPLIVLTRGKPEYSPTPGVSVQELDEDRKRLQAELVRLSRNSRQVLVEDSGHHIHVEQPAAVTAAIREVVEAARNHTSVTVPRKR